MKRAIALVLGTILCTTGPGLAAVAADAPSKAASAVAWKPTRNAMGQPDLYPFVLSPPAIEKLGFIHKLVHGANVAAAPAA